MKDNLEQLVKKQRQAFDDLEPSNKVWVKIRKSLNGSSSINWMWKVAAVFFFCTTVGLIALDNQQEKSNLAENQAVDVKDFESVESFYFNMISEKKSMIYDFESEHLAIDQDFELDLQKLDAMYQVLKEEQMKNPSKQVKDALILNLLIRIDILNEQLQELDKVQEENSDEEANEDVSA